MHKNPSYYEKAMELTNNLLIAMPSIDEPMFEKSVVYIIHHDAYGAMGLHINQATHSRVSDILTHMEIEYDYIIDDFTVLDGGPVETETGFVLHSPIESWQSSIVVSDQVAMTTSQDILMAIAANEPPEEYVMTLGYCNWNGTDLEEEIMDNQWLVVPATREILFHTPTCQRYKQALRLAGIQSPNLMPQIVGHA